MENTIQASQVSQEKNESTRRTAPRNRPRQGRRQVQPFQDQDQEQ